ncbi:MAG: hypothetical protein JJT76_04755 [Clostridiaceae bacterium]|nr:hypothetical protein [Clostridiaceae bacterium]
MTHIIKYDASEYNDQNKIWASILKSMFKKFEKEKGFMAKIYFSFNRFKNKSKKNIWKYITMIATLLIICVWWVIVNKKTSNLSQLNKILFYSSISIVPVVMGIINIVIPFIKNQMKTAMPLSDMVINKIELPDYSKDLGYRESIKEDFKDLLEVWLKKQKKSDLYDERLVIFVDELDRCSEQSIVELLESLQLFLSVKHVVIVLAINFNSVYYALQKKIGYMVENSKNEDKVKLCINYLEKYISIPFYLRFDGNYDQYISSLLENNKIKTNNKTDDAKKEVAASSEQGIFENDEKYVFDIEEQNTFKEILNYLNKFTHVTPRTIKRILNILILSKRMCMEINEQAIYSEKIIFNNYIRWFLFSYFSPKSSFNLQRFLNNKQSFYNLRLILASLLEKDKQNLYCEDETSAQILEKYLLDIKVNEIRMFRQISDSFILDEKKYIF